jgi:hypothetical protein
MKSLGLNRYALAIGAAAALLGGCGGSQPSLGAPGAMPRNPAIATHADRGKSWMLPEAKSEGLLYIADACGGLCISTYPAGKLVGSIAIAAGFLCTNQQGDVFVTTQNGSTGQIVEFAHGGTEPIATLADTGYFPFGCSVDKTTGNLAVANYLGFDDQNGNVTIYPAGKGSPVTYTPPNIAHPFFCAYDNDGNLYVDGNDYSGVVIAKLAKGSSGFTDMTLNANLQDAGPLQWHSNYLAAGYGDVARSEVYRIAVSGSNGTVEGVTHLALGTKMRNEGAQFWIQADTMLIPVRRLGRLFDEIGFWRYPAGGKVRKVLSSVGTRLPRFLNDVTVSVASSR